MVLMQIGIHSIKALFVLTLIMMGTPPCCIPSSPTYATLSLPCSVLDPIPFHLVSLIPNTSIPHPTISWPLALFADGDLFLGGYYGAYRPMGFLPALAEERHYGPSSNTSGLSCIVDASGFCYICFSLRGRVVNLTPNPQLYSMLEPREKWSFFSFCKSTITN